MSRQGRPVGLIIAVIAATAAGLLLWMILRSGDDGASASAPQKPGAGPGIATEPPALARKDGEDRPGAPQVVASEEGRRAAGGEDNQVTETVVNGVRVRDHRKDKSKPFTMPEQIRAPGTRRIAAEVNQAISSQVLPIVRACVASVPADAKGAKPKVEGEMIVSIKGHQVRVGSVSVELADITGAAVEATRQCIQQKAIGLTAAAPDEDDLENYPIHLSISL